MSDEEETPCRVCGSTDQEEYLVLCDGCDAPFHTFCHHGCVCCQQKPRNNFGKKYPVPDGDWFCKFCAGRPPKLQAKQNPLSSVFAWGDNTDGQLGLGTDEAVYSTPTAVEDLAAVGVLDIAVGETSTVLLTSEGDVYSSGTGTTGQLGHQDIVHEKLTHFRKLDGFEKRPAAEGRLERVFSGRDFSALLSQHGHIYTWGNGESGQLGHQENKIKKVPKKISALREKELPVVLAAAGGDFMVMTTGVAKEEDQFHRDLPGVLMTMGANTQGQLGEGSMKNQWVPQLLNPTGAATTSKAGCTQDEPSTCLVGRDTVSLAAGNAHVVLTVAGTLGAWSWGLGQGGQLGHPLPPVPASASKFFRPTFRVVRPRFIQALEHVHVTQVACGGTHTLFLTKDHRVYGCGSNEHGQLTDTVPTDATTELPVDLQLTHHGLRVVAAGDHHSMGVTATGGAVVAWGRNDKGQLGLGHTDKSAAPTVVPGLPKIESLHTGYHATFAVEFAKKTKAAGEPAKGGKKTKGGGGAAPAGSTKRAKK
ncbi:Aste57867_8718 [Aphanomyces stellatus]|uniref:Aste57867_8718 protein n=1 Tax=Aphanomyces stellatus TaxID=120398 RepID=A0A485KLD9_9STRA|nr:hypothetical protein As57867_008684 [Aphanomyces stellatus]VFT85604.1 Aste57867_8718 [Aphanomyces stellatus]